MAKLFLSKSTVQLYDGLAAAGSHIQSVTACLGFISSGFQPSL